MQQVKTRVGNSPMWDDGLMKGDDGKHITKRSGQDRK